MTGHHLAQLNVADPAVAVHGTTFAEFIALLPEINALADRSPGFVWRLTDAGGADSTSLRPFGPTTMVNMSVWETPDDLKNFVYRSSHLDFYLKRADWFEKLPEAHYALWWIPAGHIPTVEEAKDRLDHLRRHGATPHAFWFGKLYAPDAVLA